MSSGKPALRRAAPKTAKTASSAEGRGSTPPRRPARPAPRGLLSKATARRRAPAARARLPRPLDLAFLAAVAVAVLCLPSLPGSSPRPSQPWKGYHTILVRSDSLGPGGMEGLVRRLEAAGGPGVITELTAPVDFWDFSGVATVAYARLDSRLDPLDPRRDPYLNGLRSYFRTAGDGTEWRVAYAPARQSAGLLFFRLARQLGAPWGGRWRLSGFDPFVKLLAVLGIFALGAILFLKERPRRWQTLAAAVVSGILWIPAVLAGSFAELAFSLVLVPAGASLLLERSESGTRKGKSGLWRISTWRISRWKILYGVAAGMGATLIGLFEGFTVSRTLGAICPAVATLLLAWSAPTARALFPRRAKRRGVFEPVRIVPGSAVASRFGSAVLLTAVGVLVVAVGVGGIRRIPVPSPDGVLPARGFSWSSLERQDRGRAEDTPPDLSVVVSHEAYQETLEFGRPWGFPREDERVTVPDYLYNPTTGSMVQRLRTVRVFDAAWLNSAIWGDPPGGVEQLLTAQGGAVPVRLRGGVAGLAREMPCAIIGLLALLALLAGEPGLGPLIREMLLRINSSARRNQDP